jgi:hypothetical protein
MAEPRWVIDLKISNEKLAQAAIGSSATRDAHPDQTPVRKNGMTAFSGRNAPGWTRGTGPPPRQDPAMRDCPQC